MAMNSGGGKGNSNGSGNSGGGWRGSRDSHKGIIRDDSWQRTVKRPKVERWLSGGGGSGDNAKRKSSEQEQSRNESHPPMAEIEAPKKPIERLRAVNSSRQFTTTNRDQDSQRPIQRPPARTPARDVPAREGDIDVAGKPKQPPEKQPPTQQPESPPQQPEQFVQQYNEHGYKIGPRPPCLDFITNENGTEEERNGIASKRGDLRLLAMVAKKGRFPINERLAEKAINAVEELLEDKNKTSPKTKLNAVKMVTQMQSVNLKATEIELKIEQAAIEQENAANKPQQSQQLQQPQLHLHQHRYQNDHQQSAVDAAREIEIVRPVESLIQSDSAYLEFLRQQAVQDDYGSADANRSTTKTINATATHSIAGPVCEGSEPGQVENGTASSVSGCEDNDSLDPWQC